MTDYSKSSWSLQELEQEKARIDRERAELERERKLFRRLGFSPERITLRLRRLEAERARCEEAIYRCRTRQQPNGGPATSPAINRPF